MIARIVIAAAVALATIGYLFIHQPSGWPFHDVMRGEVWLTDSCPLRFAGSPIGPSDGTGGFTRIGPGPRFNGKPIEPQKPSGALDLLIDQNAPHWPRCGLVLPYRWILSAAIVLLAAVYVVRVRKS